MIGPQARVPPPIEFGAGSWSIVNGSREYFKTDLQPGHDLLICFEQDTPADPPHAVIGMQYEFDIA